MWRCGARLKKMARLGPDLPWISVQLHPTRLTLLTVENALVLAAGTALLRKCPGLIV
jgi:hypothetical protein